MPHPLLPRTVSDAKKNKLPGFKTAGVWDRRSADQVKVVAEALDVQDRKIDLQSIPDIWARPLLFESALHGGFGLKLQESIEAEWRGLLAILALRARRSIQGINFLPVFGTDPGTKFIQAAERLLPDRLVDRNRGTDWQRVSIDVKTGWRDISLILLHDQVIGLTSPTTLVCTPPEHRHIELLQKIPWFDRKAAKLIDPKPYLSYGEQRALSSWLDQQHKFLINEGKASGDKWVKLSEALKRFIASLSTTADSEREFKLAAGLTVRGNAFRLLGTPIASEEEPDKCDVALLHFRTAAPKTRALVIDEHTPFQWQKAPTEITVVGSLPLAAALDPQTSSARDVISSIPIPNGKWYTAEDFFTAKLYLYTAGGAFPGAHTLPGQAQIRWGNRAASLILPIRKQWLDWLTADELKKRISFTQEHESIVVHLRLPLSGGDLTVAHTYNKAAIELCGQELPVTKIWPYLDSPGWNAYYTFYDNTGVDNVQFSPFTDAGVLYSQRIPVFKAQRDHRAEVTRTSCYPEALLATRDGVEAGLLLLSKPPKSVPSGEEWRIGVDFGTTGTTVYYAKKAEADGQPLKLHPHLQSITAEDPQIGILSTYTRFLPSEVEDAGALLSIFHDFNTANRQEANFIQPLTEGRICFIREGDKFDASETGISTNMKWGNPEDRARGQAFLLQIALQASAEAAASGAESVSWRFSFPTAYSEADLSTFRVIWSQIVQRAFELSGVKAKKHGDLNYRFKNESFSSAHFFRKVERASPHEGAVFLDIGGGTTDIAICQGKEQNGVRAQCSFLFAGRDIFLHPIYLRPSLLSLFGKDVSKLEEVRQSGEYIFNSQIDALLRGPSGLDLLRQLPTLSSQEGNPALTQFIELLQLGVAGMFHYVGLMLRDLEARNQFRRSLPNIYVGGNGSKILHWLALGAYGQNTPADRTLKTVFARATGFTDLGGTPFEIRISKYPKSEVAHGLLIDYDAKSDSQEPTFNPFEDEIEMQTAPPVIAGEDFSIDGASGRWNSTLDPKTDLSHVSISPELPQIKSLLQALKTGADPYLLRQCLSEVNQELADLSPEEKDRRVEPLFIKALRALHRGKAQRWAESTQAFAASS